MTDGHPKQPEHEAGCSREKSPESKCNQYLDVAAKDDVQHPGHEPPEGALDGTLHKLAEDANCDVLAESAANPELDSPQIAGCISGKQEFTFSGGATYLGNWLGNKRHGEGVQVWPDGAKFEGQWVENVADGEGTFYHADGDVYQGQWRCDRAHGHGTYTHAEGSRYEGQWEYDKQHGEGIERWPDGAQYSGRYELGRKHGYGEFMWTDGSQYQGEFAENNIHGMGLYNWKDGRWYNGHWSTNRMHGQGEFHWPDGRNYCGQYVEDQKQGIGIFSWPDGRTWQGQWGAGKQEGLGIYSTPKGDRRGGVWTNGHRDRWLEELPELSSGRDIVLNLSVTQLDTVSETTPDLSKVEEDDPAASKNVMNLFCTSMGGDEVAMFAVDVEKETLLGLRKMIATKLSVHWINIKLVFSGKGLLPTSCDQEVLAAVLSLPRRAGSPQEVIADEVPKDSKSMAAPLPPTQPCASMPRSSSKRSSSRSCCIS